MLRMRATVLARRGASYLLHDQELWEALVAEMDRFTAEAERDQVDWSARAASLPAEASFALGG